MNIFFYAFLHLQITSHLLYLLIVLLIFEDPFQTFLFLLEMPLPIHLFQAELAFVCIPVVICLYFYNRTGHIVI